MQTISAQELKQGGLTKIKKMLNITHDFIVQERGKDACVVVDLDYFNELKLCELEVAYLKTKKQLRNDEFEIITDPQTHVEQLLREIDSEAIKPKKSK